MLQIYLFGKFCAEHKGQIVAGFEARRVQEVFCYLLLKRHRPCSREILASLLWGESSTAQSKKNLRQILWQLRSVLKTETDLDAERILSANTHQVQINLNTDLWLDVDVFEQVWNKVKYIQNKDLDVRTAQMIRNAVTLHQGVLLEGIYEDWCLNERERLLSIYIEMLDKLMEYSEIHCEYEAALTYGTYILNYERTRESTHRRLMRLYYFLGNRTSALKQYQHCEAILNEDLCIQPDEHTQALYQQIVADRLEAVPDTRVSVTTTVDEEIAFFSNILEDLKQIQVIQTGLLHKVQHNIQTIEQILRGHLYSFEEINKSSDTLVESNRV